MKDLDSIDVVQQVSTACETKRTIWKHLGYELKLGRHDLAEIEATYLDVEDRCSAMLELWLQKPADASWGTLRKALVIVGLDELVSMIDQQSPTRPTSDSDTKSTTNPSMCTSVSVCVSMCVSVCVCYAHVCVCVLRACVCTLCVCATCVCALRVCALRVCALRVCALRVCALRVCALRVCVHYVCACTTYQCVYVRWCACV